MLSNLSFMPIANKVGKKGQEVHCKHFLGKIQQMANKSGNRSLS